jgi:hypothetical protein
MKVDLKINAFLRATGSIFKAQTIPRVYLKINKSFVF